MSITYTNWPEVGHWLRTVPKKWGLPPVSGPRRVEPHGVFTRSVDIHSSRLICRNPGGGMPTSLENNTLNTLF